MGLILLMAVLMLSVQVFALHKHKALESEKTEPSPESEIYQKLAFPSLSEQAFKYAYEGHMSIADSLKLGQRYLLIADLSLPSSQKRFFLVDLVDTQVIYHDYVAHGKNSGGEIFANCFSNTPESKQSSLGFYRVSECYYGEHGLSIRLDGLDACYNDKARDRAIVMHTAFYAKPDFIEEYGRVGRSWGCPVLPPDGFNTHASLISGNSLLFIYYPDEGYLKNSVWLH